MTELLTERLRLRLPDPEDYPEFEALMVSDRAKYIGGPRTRGEAWRQFAGEFGHWQIRGFGMFTICWRDTGASLGMVGPWYPIDFPEKELGWFLWPEAEGKGVAYEAALEARRWVFEDLGWETAVSYIDQDNARSIQLAERLGAVPDPDADRPDPEDIVYRHPRPEDLS